MRAVNLLPRDDTREGRKVPPMPVLVLCVGLVLVAAVTAMMYLSASSKVAKQRDALVQVQAELAGIPAPPAPSPVITQLPQQRTDRVAALAGALGQRVAWDRVLREISQVVPSDVWLVKVDAKSPVLATAADAASAATAATGLPTGIILTGCTYSQDSVARFLARAQLVPDLGDMTLGRSVSSEGSSSDASSVTVCPAKMFTFNLNGNVRLTPGAAS
ncbi:MAG: hypothetical protein QOH95_1755 [Gaiellaceae bacterium]|jgi:Tfp pilus assembly protein PilN|nr:hypothetical protein [Gaiellaceae bacterium]